MSQAYIKDGEDYNKTIEDFKLKIKQFETAAEQTILLLQCGRDADGAQENFYTHTLLKYLVPIMKTTFENITWALASIRCKALSAETKSRRTVQKDLATTTGIFAKAP